eukprot:9626689-Prorocentrum_lima.AAC.1
MAATLPAACTARCCVPGSLSMDHPCGRSMDDPDGFVCAAHGCHRALCRATRHACGDHAFYT